MFGRSFWQNEPFYAVSHGRINILRPMHDVSDVVGLFLAATLNAATGNDFNYQTMCTRARLSNVVLALPATPDGEPDWEYMENYMRIVMDREEVFAEHLASLMVETGQHVVDTSEWKAFRVGDLFECDTTKSIPSKNDLDDGNIPYVTRSSVDNGFSGTCGNIESINKGHCITIGAEGFVAFWQTDDFVAGNKVYTLRHHEMDDVRGLFVCSALNVLASEYSFANARVLDSIKNEIIELPATSDGSPDWGYMDAYMRQIMEREETYAIELERLL